LGGAATRTAARTQALPPPVVHVTAVPGLGIIAAAAQKLVPEAVHSFIATP
jgi:hypothetical protein